MTINDRWMDRSIERAIVCSGGRRTQICGRSLNASEHLASLARPKSLPGSQLKTDFQLANTHKRLPTEDKRKTNAKQTWTIYEGRVDRSMDRLSQIIDRLACCWRSDSPQLQKSNDVVATTSY